MSLLPKPPAKRNLPILLRPANQEDVNFVFSSWLRSYKKNSTYAKQITNTIYFNEHHKIIEKLLRNFQTIIACDKEDSTNIYGFINAGFVDGIFCINYVYVKHTYRRFGVGEALLHAFDHDFDNASVFTHHTRMAEKLAAKYRTLYHPYLLINDFITTKAENDSES